MTPPGEGTQSLNVSYSANTNVGTATANATYAGDSNHAGASGMATFMITAATPTVTLTCPASVVYNGALQTPCSATVTDATNTEPDADRDLLEQHHRGHGDGQYHLHQRGLCHGHQVGDLRDHDRAGNGDGGQLHAVLTGPRTLLQLCVFGRLHRKPDLHQQSGLRRPGVGPVQAPGTVTPTYTNDTNFTITAVNGSVEYYAGIDDCNGNLPAERQLTGAAADAMHGDGNGRGRTEPDADGDTTQQHQRGHGDGQCQLLRRYESFG